MYVKVLLWIEELGRGCFKPEHFIEMAQDMDLDANDFIDAKIGLYTFLCTYTAGSVKRSVRRFRQKCVF